VIKNHFTATGIVFNKLNEILMIKHKKLGVWLPPGGHINKNELPCDAVLREIFEETGVKAKVVSAAPPIGLGGDMHCKELAHPFVILLEDIERTWLHNHIDLVYLCIAEENNYKKSEREADDIGWFPAEAIQELLTFENVRNVIAAAAKFMQKK
jgi:8-oxo-dGTP pyrophosphatase MutT (NUDIX family)